eukprot:1158730-Pelagomonas_calceolata.AAC.11
MRFGAPIFGGLQESNHSFLEFNQQPPPIISALRIKITTGSFSDQRNRHLCQACTCTDLRVMHTDTQPVEYECSACPSSITAQTAPIFEGTCTG